MENKLILLIIGMMLITPLVVADNSGWKLYPDRSEYDGVEDNDPEFWIDKYHTDENGNKVYHIDALRDLYIDENNESNNEKVRLYLPYLVQPDWIKHINHEGEYVRTYFPTNEDWEWEYECDEEVEDCSDYEGYVILRVDKIDEGLGSNTFPIGIIGPTWATNGQQYGEFDGETGYIGVSDNTFNSTFNVTHNITISSWINSNTISDTSSSIVFIGNDDNNPLFAINSPSTSQNSIRCFTGNNTDFIETSSQSIDNEDWVFLTCTFISNGVSLIRTDLYIDGDYKRNETGNISYYEHSIGVNSIRIGVQKLSSNRYFNGSIDEVLIYNRSLSQTEITALYANYTVTSTGINRTGTPSTEGLVLDINFDDYSVADNSGSGNHGTNTNVTFGDVYTSKVTLTEGTDYNTSGTTFNILNTDYSWSWINTSYNWLQTNSSITRQITGNGTLALSSFMSNATTWLSLLGVVIIMMIISVVVIVVNKFGRTII